MSSYFNERTATRKVPVFNGSNVLFISTISYLKIKHFYLIMEEKKKLSQNKYPKKPFIKSRCCENGSVHRA